MKYKLTQIHYQMQAEIYPDLSGRGDIDQRRVKPYVNAGTPLRKPQRGDITQS